MSDTKAIAVTAFRGAPDGSAYPDDYLKGDPVFGDLADVALAEKWARAPKDDAEFATAEKAREARLAKSA